MGQNLIDRTPVEMRCISGACSSIYENQAGNYIIVGKVIKPEQYGLAEKVGEHEAAIEIPKGLLAKVLDEKNLKKLPTDISGAASGAGFGRVGTPKNVDYVRLADISGAASGAGFGRVGTPKNVKYVKIEK